MKNYKIVYYTQNKIFYTNDLKNFKKIKAPFKLYEKINNEYILNGLY